MSSPAYYIGKGKAEQIAEQVKTKRVDVVIFDNDLTPAQIRDLEEIADCKVIDRSELILDIFATRARRWNLGDGFVALLSDTVGFVRDIPHHLVGHCTPRLKRPCTPTCY